MPRYTNNSNNFEVEAKLYKLILNGDINIKKIEKEVEKLSIEHKGQVYSTLLNVLTNLTFSEKEAKKHWEKISKHKEKLTSILKRNVDFRTAILDYFISESRKMKNPVIVEIKLFHKTKESVIIDDLTKIYNYRYFNIALKKELARAKRYDNNLSLLLLDIDNFKQYNDRQGHPTGNLALRKLAKILSTSVRESDTVVRYGGEEFAIILPDTTKDGAFLVAEKLRRKVEKARFPSKSGKINKKLTFSGGISSFPYDAKTEDELIEKADQALYLAKQSGKNAIKIYSKERRAYARISSSIIGSFSLISSEKHFLQTKNLSENGILFSTNKLIPLSTLLEMNLNIPGIDHMIKLKARVVRVDEIRKNREYDIGVHIVSMNKRDRKNFMRFLKSISR